VCLLSPSTVAWGTAQPPNLTCWSTLHTSHISHIFFAFLFLLHQISMATSLVTLPRFDYHLRLSGRIGRKLLEAGTLLRSYSSGSYSAASLLHVASRDGVRGALFQENIDLFNGLNAPFHTLRLRAVPAGYPTRWLIPLTPYALVRTLYRE
jgi:hypothetical protein